MRLSHEEHDQLSVMSIRGDLTCEHADAFRKAAAGCLAQEVRDFVLDVAGMEFIDSRGLEALLWLQEQSVEKLGQVRLAGAGEHVAKILEITRLAGRFDCHADVDAAIKSLR